MDNVLKEESVRKEILGDKLYKKMQKASMSGIDVFGNAAYTAYVIKDVIDSLV